MNAESRRFALSVTPRDPLIARDGRPFSLGLRMRGLDWIHPSVFAGSLRTLVGHAAGGFPPAASDEYADLTKRLRNIGVTGPLLRITTTERDELAFPAPLDAVCQFPRDGSPTIHPLRPWDDEDPAASCDFLPDHRLFPVTFSDEVNPEFKTEPAPPFWSNSVMSDWLTHGDGQQLVPAGRKEWPSGFYRAASRDTRFHARIDPDSGAAENGQLFMTTSLDLTRLQAADRTVPWNETPTASVAARISTPDFEDTLQSVATWSPLGGERRIAHWKSTEAADDDALWTMSSDLKKVLQTAKYIRLILATPAIFASGWQPGWLTSPSPNMPPAGKIGEVGLTLIGAAVGRWKAISGWSYQPPIGAKPVRRMVPAGSVYFFRVDSGDPAALAQHWLESVCDDAQDRRDGFGLALWGAWNPFEETHTFKARAS